MVYNELYFELDEEVKTAVHELFDLAVENQLHSTDILAIRLHCFKDRRHEEAMRNSGLSPYMFGSGDGLYEHTLDSFYEFFDFYRKSTVPRDQFKADLISEDRQKRAFTNQIERSTLNVEMLIYLKFWEADLILRQLYNLDRLARGHQYKWNMNPRKFEERAEVIEKILNNLSDIAPNFCTLIGAIYNSNIRNAVAHSKYFLGDRRIHFTLNAYRETMLFDDWEVLFHKTILLYNHMIGKFKEIENGFKESLHEYPEGIPLYLPENDDSGNPKVQRVTFEDASRRWLYTTQLR